MDCQVECCLGGMGWMDQWSQDGSESSWAQALKGLRQFEVLEKKLLDWSLTIEL